MTVLYAFLAFMVVFYLWFNFEGYRSRKGQIPGVKEGKLQLCDPLAMNCVCSEHKANRIEQLHFVEPIVLENMNATAVLEIAAHIVEEMGGDICSQDEVYLAALFRSRLFGFVDDFELRLDREAGLLHVRSASRVGKHDAFVNKKRVDRFRSLWKNAINE